MTKRICDLPCQVYSRVVGYYNPIESWNIGKREEFRERKPFKVDETKLKQEEFNNGKDKI